MLSNKIIESLLSLSQQNRSSSFTRLGLQIHLAQNENEQKFVNSLAPYNANWLRIQFQNQEIYSDDAYRGKFTILEILKTLGMVIH